MSRRLSPVSLGELIRAVDRLGISEPANIRHIAKLLDLPIAADTTATTVTDLEAASEAASRLDIEPAADAPEELSEKETETDALPKNPVLGFGDTLSMEREGSVRLLPPKWLDAAGPLGRFEPSPAGEAPSLFAPAVTRDLVASLVASEVPSGALDVAAAIRSLAYSQPLDEVPRLPMPSLRFGVQVLLDRGEAMRPYRRDQGQIVRDLQKVVGEQRVDVLRFANMPDRAGVGTRRTWKPYSFPSVPSPILVVSDLGLVRFVDRHASAAAGAWPAFARRARRAGCRVAALVPYAPKYWPQDLSSQMQLVYWDRPTTVASVRFRRTASGDPWM